MARSLDAAGGQILEGVRVLDLTQIVSGPSATLMLANLGAEVIKVERPRTGEPYRHEGRVIANAVGTVTANFLRFSRSKRSLTLDLKQPAGRRLLLQLAERSDVLVENFSSGVMERLGLGYGELSAANPRLVYASISGFGRHDVLPGPLMDQPAYAIIAEAYSGLLDQVGESVERPPHWLGFAMADLAAGVFAFGGILGALFARERTGRGSRLDVAMHDAAMFMNEQAVCLYSATAELMRRGTYGYQAPWGIFPVTDGYVALAIMGNEQWTALCEASGSPELAADPRCATGILRAEHMKDLVEPRLSAWLMSHGRDEVVRDLQRRGVPCAPVNTAADLFSSPQVAAHGMLVEVDHEVAGRVSAVGNPIKIRGVPDPRPMAPPLLGADTDTLLRQLLLLDDTAIAALRDQGVI